MTDMWQGQFACMVAGKECMGGWHAWMARMDGEWMIGNHVIMSLTSPRALTHSNPSNTILLLPPFPRLL